MSHNSQEDHYHEPFYLRDTIRLISNIVAKYNSGWWFQPLWKILVNGKDDIPYIMKNNPSVWNHQPVVNLMIIH